MYCTTPSGTRYQTGWPAPTRARHSVEEIDSAGISTRLTFPSGRPAPDSRCPGLVQPTKCARVNSSSAACQVRISASASAPVMKKNSSSAPVDVDAAHAELGVGRGGDDRHQVPVLGRGYLTMILLVGLSGRHEDDLI